MPVDSELPPEANKVAYVIGLAISALLCFVVILGLMLACVMLMSAITGAL